MTDPVKFGNHPFHCMVLSSAGGGGQEYNTRTPSHNSLGSHQCNAHITDFLWGSHTHNLITYWCLKCIFPYKQISLSFPPGVWVFRLLNWVFCTRKPTLDEQLHWQCVIRTNTIWLYLLETRITSLLHRFSTILAISSAEWILPFDNEAVCTVSHTQKVKGPNMLHLFLLCSGFTALSMSYTRAESTQDLTAQ